MWEDDDDKISKLCGPTDPFIRNVGNAESIFHIQYLRMFHAHDRHQVLVLQGNAEPSEGVIVIGMVMSANIAKEFNRLVANTLEALAYKFQDDGTHSSSLYLYCSHIGYAFSVQDGLSIATFKIWTQLMPKRFE